MGKPKSLQGHTKVLFLFLSKVLFSVGLANSKMKVTKVDHQRRESLQEKTFFRTEVKSCEMLRESLKVTDD